jgi:hypothetical protein
VISEPTFYKLYFVHSFFWLPNFGMDDATLLLPIKQKKNWEWNSPSKTHPALNKSAGQGSKLHVPCYGVT